MYKTKKRGFAVRALHDIPKGTFICSYAGKIIQNTRSILEEDNEYLMNLNYDYCYKEKLIKNTNAINEVNQEDHKIKNQQKEIKEQNNENLIQIDDLACLSDLNSSDSDTTFSDLTFTDISDSSSISDCDLNDKLDEDKNESTDKISEDHNEDSNENNESSRKRLKKELSQVIDSDFLIDSREVGNVARFLNHSCNPNIAAQPVLIETQNRIFTHYAFFACKDIKSFTELKFNYFESDEEEDIHFVCKCNSKKCISRIKK